MARAGRVDEALEGIVDRIVDGTFAVGSALPREAELAEMLGVSRPTMREAVRSLSDGGVLRVVHGRGTYLAPRSSWRHLPTLIAVVARTTSPLELGLQLTQIRRMIEVGSAGLAAESRTDEDLQSMSQLLDEFDRAHAAGDNEAAVKADIDFHEAILQASGNPFLGTIMQPLGEALHKSRHVTTSSPEVRVRAQTHHRKILDRIAAGDASGAKDAMRAHMTQTRDDIVGLQSK